MVEGTFYSMAFVWSDFFVRTYVCIIHIIFLIMHGKPYKELYAVMKNGGNTSPNSLEVSYYK